VKKAEETKHKGVSMANVSVRELLEAGVHFGHQTHRWNPKMKPYIFGKRNGIHIINLNLTAKCFNKALQFASDLTANGEYVLFVGTKRQSSDIIETEAKKAGMYYVSNRWLGGTLTNFKTIRASIDRLKKLEKLKESENFAKLTKKEGISLNRDIEKLYKNLGGISSMTKQPGAVFVSDCNKEKIAILEAKKLGIPVIAVVDSNSDPTFVDYVIPGNDDAIRSVQLYCSKMSEACGEGAALYQHKLKSSPAPKERPAEEMHERTVKVVHANQFEDGTNSPDSDNDQTK